MEPIVFILLYFYSHLYKFCTEELLFAVSRVTSHVAVTKRDLIQLLDVLNVINREALLEFFGKLLYVLSVTDW
jgi:hypothetical protein